MANSSKLAAKLFCCEYGYSENHITNRWGFRLSDTRVRVMRPNGSYSDYSEGDDIPGISGNVQIHDQHVQMGPYTVALFDVSSNDNDFQSLTLGEGYAREVKKKNEKSFMIERASGRLSVKEGDEIDGEGRVSLTDNNQLKVGNKVIPVYPVLYEINLIALNEPLHGGYKAYFNVKMPGDSRNNRDGIAGVFFPRKGKLPANFSELHSEDGELYKTATFWSTKNPRFASAYYRSLEEAVEERSLYLLQSGIKKQCQQSGFPKEDHPYFDLKNEERLSELNDQSKNWKRGLFTVMQGQNLVQGYPQNNNRHQGATPTP